ncbi:retrotransposon protein, putative, ty1-copia subclass, partial [Tanacetum coccineum]
MQDTLPVSACVDLRSARKPQAHDRYGFYVDVEEHELGDLNEPASYKSALNVGSKWLFKKKTDMDGNVHTFKARIMEKGYTQTYDVDYGGTFSYAAEIRAIRILIAITTFYVYEIWQINVKTAFLNRYLSEDIYMVQPEGEATYILGIKIDRDKSKRLIALSQNAYIDKMLKRFRIENSKCGNIPMKEKPNLSKSQGVSIPKEVRRMHRVPYSLAIRSIMLFKALERKDVEMDKIREICIQGMSKRTGQENIGGIMYQAEEEDWWHKLLHLRNKRGGRISPLGSIPINRGLIQDILTSLPPQPIGEATNASNLRRISLGVQGRSHFTYFLYLIVQIRIL